MDRSTEHDHKPPEVPPGYHFTPTPEELVHHYLNPWITGQPLGELEKIVRHADVYGSEPGRLTEEHRRFGHDGHWYFFSVAKWKGTCRGAGARFNRCVKDGGTWHNSQRRRPVDGCGDGCSRLCFEYRDADNGKTDWLMEELTSNLPEAIGADGVKVICKVYLTPRERQENRRPPLPRPEQHELVPEPLQPEVRCSNASGGMSQATTDVPTNYCLMPVYNGGNGGVAIKTEAEEQEPSAMERGTIVLESKRCRMHTYQQEHHLPEAGSSNATAADRVTSEATIPMDYYYCLTFTSPMESTRATKSWYDEMYGLEAAPDHGGTGTQNQPGEDTVAEFVNSLLNLDDDGDDACMPQPQMAAKKDTDT
ncbi:hypothetical protein ABZP36_012543 [Zizania latifolia]